MYCVVAVAEPIFGHGKILKKGHHICYSLYQWLATYGSQAISGLGSEFFWTASLNSLMS